MESRNVHEVRKEESRSRDVLEDRKGESRRKIALDISWGGIISNYQGHASVRNQGTRGAGIPRLEWENSGRWGTFKVRRGNWGAKTLRKRGHSRMEWEEIEDQELLKVREEMGIRNIET